MTAGLLAEGFLAMDVQLEGIRNALGGDNAEEVSTGIRLARYADVDLDPLNHLRFAIALVSFLRLRLVGVLFEGQNLGLKGWGGEPERISSIQGVTANRGAIGRPWLPANRERREELGFDVVASGCRAAEQEQQGQHSKEREFNLVYRPR